MRLCRRVLNLSDQKQKEVEMMKMEKPCLISSNYVNTFFKKRGRELHKGNCGKILIIAGSFGMAGAAVLCARAALRSGAGLVRVSVPEFLFPIIQTSVVEATCVTRQLTKELISGVDAVVIGPGLGEDDGYGLLIRKVLQGCKGTVVLDADGLNLLSNDRTLLDGKKANLILTPHPGEAGRLLGKSAKEINENRQSAVREMAEEFAAIVLLKGAGTLVATPEGKTYINTTGNPGMATGGCGDVLSGVIATLAGQGYSPEQAATAGVYLHGKAGDLGTEKLGEYGLIASDIASMMALAIKITLEEQNLEK